MVKNATAGHNDPDNSCRLCGGRALVLLKPGNIQTGLSSDQFAVTESRYGTTAAIYKCMQCQLIQCPDIHDPLPFYQALDDPEYDRSSEARSLQMNGILKTIGRFKTSGRLLDIGAATGLLVALAMERGYAAQGIEPSRSFQAIAAQKNLPVHLGTFPSSEIRGRFDIITLIDVIEHVADPVELLTEIRKALSEEGIGVLITPDVSSLAARLLGWRWWHYRIAHISYFNKETLFKALSLAGLSPIFFQRPSWFFPLGYLIERMTNYLPPFFAKCFPDGLGERIVPINFFDSMLVVVKRKKSLPF